MKKIEYSKKREINNFVKKYYDLPDICMTDIDNYIDEDGLHKHEIADQIIFVISGILKIFSDNNEIVIMDNEVIHIPAGEFHQVIPITKETKIFILKYKSNNENISQILKKDYVRK